LTRRVFAIAPVTLLGRWSPLIDSSYLRDSISDPAWGWVPLIDSAYLRDSASDPARGLDTMRDPVAAARAGGGGVLQGTRSGRRSKGSGAKWQCVSIGPGAGFLVLDFFDEKKGHSRQFLPSKFLKFSLHGSTRRIKQ
jgi:hypothetical protein